MIWVYLTGWSNGDGPANFRDDVYGLDTVGDAIASAAAAPGAGDLGAPLAAANGLRLARGGRPRPRP